MSQSLFWSSLLAFLLLAPGPAPGQQEDDLLDLRPPAERPKIELRLRPQGFGPGYEGQPAPKPWPVKVVLLSTDRTSYMLGDRVVFEFSLENVGSVAMTIPWGAASDLARIAPGPDEPPGYLTAIVSLVSDGESVAMDFMHGSRLEPHSLRSLKPGERVRVRAYAMLQGFGKRIYDKLPVDASLKAKFTFAQGTPEGFSLYDRWVAAVSANSITVRVAGR
jgi:hypothetical protein